MFSSKFGDLRGSTRTSRDSETPGRPATRTNAYVRRSVLPAPVRGRSGAGVTTHIPARHRHAGSAGPNPNPDFFPHGAHLRERPGPRQHSRRPFPPTASSPSARPSVQPHEPPRRSRTSTPRPTCSAQPHSAPSSPHLSRHFTRRDPGHHHARPSTRSSPGCSGWEPRATRGHWAPGRWPS